MFFSFGHVFSQWSFLFVRHNAKSLSFCLLCFQEKPGETWLGRFSDSTTSSSAFTCVLFPDRLTVLTHVLSCYNEDIANLSQQSHAKLCRMASRYVFPEDELFLAECAQRSLVDTQKFSDCVRMFVRRVLDVQLRNLRFEGARSLQMSKGSFLKPTWHKCYRDGFLRFFVWTEEWFLLQPNTRTSSFSIFLHSFLWNNKSRETGSKLVVSAVICCSQKVRPNWQPISPRFLFMVRNRFAEDNMINLHLP